MIGRHILRSLILLIACACGSKVGRSATLDDLWNGRAHFQQVSELQYGKVEPGGPGEASSWYAVDKGRWFAFSHVTLPPIEGCPFEHLRTVVRESRDRGKNWSQAVVAVEPGASPRGDYCAVTDGSTFRDPDTGIWHILAQCMDRNKQGGWLLCHYTRHADEPMGRFDPDTANPVVRGGQLWSRICAGLGKACPPSTIDEGTPDIVGKKGGLFEVTIHGFDSATFRGFRGVVATPDFRKWITAGSTLPGDATLSANDCRGWLSGCVGFGESSSLMESDRIYMITEMMNKSLLCVERQDWVFALLRAPSGNYPRSGSGGWRARSQAILIRPTWPDPASLCAVRYAKFLRDGDDIYLAYEDWEPKLRAMHRRLLKLVSGGGPAIVLR